MAKSVLLVGVGGQGTILMSKILSEGFLESGYDVKMSEIHGMSQRGGSVTTQIRFGDKVQSPSIDEGTADILIAFEKCEAGRFLKFLKPDGKLVVNDVRIYPLPVLSGAQTYPENILDELVEKVPNIQVVQAAALADEAGTRKAQNIVMLGAFVRAMGLEDIDWKALIRKLIPERFHDVNLKAYDLGYDSAKA